MKLRQMHYRLSLWGKWLLFPGLDLHTRCRYRFLPRFFREGPVDTLDAGCGNGALSYAAYLRGNRVLGVTLDDDQVQKALAFFSFRGVDPARLKFEVCNLYDLPRLTRTFDQIICAETLEHIAGDKFVVQYFYNLLREDGVLHLCCPFSDHPANRGRVCTDEAVGWHVREGYTLQRYAELLEPVGFRIVMTAGLGSPLLVGLASIVQFVWNRKGTAAALPLFLVTWPLQVLDYLNPSVPLSLYVQAVKKS
jgi:SAM-dependent methyltransferase